MKRVALQCLLAIAVGPPVFAEAANDGAWDRIVETDEGEYYLDRQSIADSTFNGAAVLKAKVKILKFKAYPGATEFHGEHYFRCDPPGSFAIQARARTVDGRMIPFPPPAVWVFSSEPEGSPLRLVIEKACATL